MVSPDATSASETQFEWEEWKMESADGSSAIEVPGRPVSVSAAYTGRVAVAYQTGTSFHKKDDQDSKYVNLCTAIFECESTGGSDWIREDVIHLKNIELRPELPDMDLSVYDDTDKSKIQEQMQKFAKKLTEDVEKQQSNKASLKGIFQFFEKKIILI